MRPKAIFDMEVNEVFLLFVYDLVICLGHGTS